jgi:predicted SnoaL-like aldol condensation-catalyzing enzyme
MVNYMETTYPDGTVDIKRVLADGDIVVPHVHSLPTPGERGSAIAEFFRLADGKIVEHTSYPRCPRRYPRGARSPAAPAAALHNQVTLAGQ